MKTKTKYQYGGMTGFEKRQAKKLGRAETKAAVANIEGEGTVAQKRDNRAERVAAMAGTARAKTPKSVSTSTSNSTSTVNNSQAPGMTKPTQEPKTTGKTVSKPGTSPSKPTPEYKKASVKTVSKDSVKSPVRYQNGGTVKPAAKKPAVKKATPPRSTMDMIRGSKKSDYSGTVTQSAKQGGSVKKYQAGGTVSGPSISEKAAERKVAKGKGTISKSYPSGPEEKGSYVGYSKEARKSDGPWKSMKDSKPARPIMKTGGMVNSNAKVSALKTAGSHGVKSGVNPKAAASKVVRGRVGGTSSAPKTAVPKARMGGAMKRKSC
jgi:hypothetical protein